MTDNIWLKLLSWCDSHLTIQAQILLSSACLYYLVIQLFYISVLNRIKSLFIGWTFEVIWLLLGKLHHWFVSFLPKAVKVALFHTDVIVNTNAGVDSEITRQKAHSWKMTSRWSRIHAYVCVYICQLLSKLKTSD